MLQGLDNIDNHIDRRSVLVFLAGVLIVGLFFSRALISIATVLLFVNALFNKDIKANFLRYWNNKPALAFSLIFLLAIFSGLFSENTTTWFEWVRIKATYFILPFAILGIPALHKKQYYGLLYFFFFVTIVACLWWGGNYYLNFTEYTDAYGRGGSMETGIIYVRFSLFTAFGIVIGGFLWWEKFVLRYKWERILIAIGTVFLFVFLHILAVRTGLFALYNTLFLTVCYWIVKQRKWLIGGLALVAMFAFPVVAYQTVPSLKKKIEYMRYDLELYFRNDSKAMTSDYRRLISIENGIRVGKENSVLVGSGIGDLRDEMNRLYDLERPNIDKKLLPHNQWIFIFAAYGLVGLVVFLFVTLYPLFYRKNYQFWFFVCFHIVTFSSFLAETTIELQIGYSYYLLFVLLGLSYLREKNIEEY